MVKFEILLVLRYNNGSKGRRAGVRVGVRMETLTKRTEVEKSKDC